MIDAIIVILSEIALALYPILIKRVDTDLFTQIFSRLLTFSTMAFVLAKPTDIQQTLGTGTGLVRSLGLGLITFLHIGFSYFAFETLPVGVAMSLFYSYPILNLLGAWLGFGEKLDIYHLGLVFLAFTGVLMVSFSMTEEKEGEKLTTSTKGILAALSAAITETAMYFAVRTAKQPNPMFATLELYPAALIYFLATLLITKRQIDWSPSAWIPMTAFNALIGFVGYALRFYAIPRVSTFVFSLLTFIGVIASFLWGYVFVKEIPSWLALVGSSLISIGAGLANGNH
jgi:drug/metabolite transporter (DMT)-like permease